MKCDTPLAGYQTGIAEEHISDAPEFSDDTTEFPLTGAMAAERRLAMGTSLS